MMEASSTHHDVLTFFEPAQSIYGTSDQCGALSLIFLMSFKLTYTALLVLSVPRM